MAVRIDVLEFSLSNKVSPKAGGRTPCVGTIDGVTLEKFEFSEVPPADPEHFRYPFLGPTGAKQTDIPLWLREVGWAPGEPAGGGDEGPTSFSAQLNFAALHVAYLAPVTCACAKGSTTRHFRMEIDYERSGNSGPDLRLTETAADGIPFAQQDPAVRVKKVTPRTDPFQHNDKWYANHFITEEITVEVACPCEPLSPCLASFTLAYKFRVVGV